MLLDDIIDILADESKSLNSALLKAKVLLHTIGKKDLAQWITYEQTGYPDGIDLPDYRTVSSEVFCHVYKDGWEFKHQAVPLSLLKEETQKALKTSHITMGIDEIEKVMIQFRQSSGGLQRPLTPELCTVLSKQMKASVVRMWCELNMIDVGSIVSIVRGRLLDFALELRDVVGTDAPNSQLIEKSSTVDTEKMFATAIYGGTNTIVVGDANTITINNTRGDMAGLAEQMFKIGLTKPQVHELQQAIQEDEKQGREISATNDGITSQWYMKALKEGGKGLYKAGVDLASQMMIKAIELYARGRLG